MLTIIRLLLRKFICGIEPILTILDQWPTTQLSGEFLNNYDTDTPIEELWSEFKDICRKCLNQVPTKLSNKRPQQPWITARIKRLSNKKQWLYNKARLSHNSDDFYVYKEFKKTVQKE